MAHFELGGGEYQRLRFGTLGAFVEIRVDVLHMSAVNAILMKEDQFPIYVGLEEGELQYEAFWPGLSHLHKLIALQGGQWNLVIESRGLPSRGRATIREFYP